ncbi:MULTISPECIES: MerR family transcriptional regulator [unclassified Lactobacillus]|uniref:MerR family transcriptional regulator n=1 Tax=unclassified Lactobacillus TaxID=2620435 RepID=UPI000EFD06C7|nr:MULTISPECIES: MerR family transcriptional regulator [unclassified Lactobacillus]RMC24232.1 MerR family transcriptional regulator [Lactobacillus sp. ESL0247]RMC28805.1 MerR family transcriptional regulator [Lactobacillus sp. ESL0246]RMC31462.1 MerR family transcriptional regulator [Lactobacillus sp. ESL0245]
MSYSVHEAAHKVGLTPYAVRYYDDNGMLPYVKRDANNNRIFNDIDLEWLQIIVCLRETGMPLKEIQHYLTLVQQGKQTVPERYQIMLKQQQKTLHEITELKQHLRTINRKVSHYAEILANDEPDSYEPTNLQNMEQNRVEEL